LAAAAVRRRTHVENPFGREDDTMRTRSLLAYGLSVSAIAVGVWTVDAEAQQSSLERARAHAQEELKTALVQINLIPNTDPVEPMLIDGRRLLVRKRFGSDARNFLNGLGHCVMKSECDSLVYSFVDEAQVTFESCNLLFHFEATIPGE